ncbi:unnamed protein product [Caenorhabditis sp. 36 PRJEB53466]|nr:unnamed protein product [Caenorhabditis sp. 36 PRJEB53466]
MNNDMDQLTNMGCDWHAANYPAFNELPYEQRAAMGCTTATPFYVTVWFIVLVIFLVLSVCASGIAAFAFFYCNRKRNVMGMGSGSHGNLTVV